MLQILLIIFLFFGLLLFLTKKLFLPTERNDFSWLSKERVYLDPKTQKQLPFPSYKEPASVELSVIVPAYNEEERISVMLDEALGFLKEKKQKQPGFTYEIIVVDDGSKDKTDSIVWRYSEKEGSEIVRLVKLEKNMGKGGALKVGMMCGRGRFLLMADADGATTFSDVERLEKSMKEILKDDQGIVVGSRAHLVNTDTVTSRKWYRNLLMYFFHLLVQMCVKGIRDTQCGFKLFSRKAAQALFPSLHVNRWAFDVELLYLATNHLHIPVAEASVNWTEIEGSKLDPLTSSFQMARDLMRIRLCYLFSVWSLYEERKKGK